MPCAQKSTSLVEPKMKLCSHVEKCVVDNHCLVIHDHSRPVNVVGYNPKSRSKCAHTVTAAVAYDEPKAGQVYILMINQAIEMKGFDQHLLWQIQ